MLTGYLFAVLAMLSIGVLGVLSKLADVHGCKPLNTALVLFGGSAVIMGIYVVIGQQRSLIPPVAVGGTAIVFGALAILAFWVFLYGLQFGKITSSWIFMNMSAIVPATLSAVIYRERITTAKAIVLVLVVISVLLLWKDKQEDSAASTAAEPGRKNVNVWIVAMLAAFLLNGTCPFGLRILAGWGLADQYTAVYPVVLVSGGVRVRAGGPRLRAAPTDEGQPAHRSRDGSGERRRPVLHGRRVVARRAGQHRLHAGHGSQPVRRGARWRAVL